MTTIKKYLIVPRTGTVSYWADEYDSTEEPYFEVFRFDMILGTLEVERLTDDGWRAIDPKG